jgi:hypothetical protein
MWQWQRGGCDSAKDQLGRIVDESKAVRMVVENCVGVYVGFGEKWRNNSVKNCEKKKFKNGNG